MSLSIRENGPDHTTDFGVTVNEAVSFIVEALEDPLNPRWCALSLMASMAVIELDHSVETLINANHLFGSIIAAFLTAKRTIADIKTLESRWSKCNCSYASLTDHGSATRIHFIIVQMAPVLAKHSSKYGEVDPFRKVVKKLTQYFKDAVTKVKPFSVAKGRHPEIWPATPKDLIPYGPEITIESLVIWSRFMGTAEVFSLVYLFMRICGPVIVPAVVASRSAPTYMIEYGFQICSDFSNASPDPTVTNAAATQTFMNELSYIGAFVQALLTLPPLLCRDHHFGFAKSAFDFATQVIKTIESPAMQQSCWPDLERVTEMFGYYAATLYTTLPEQMTVPQTCVHPTICTAVNRIIAPSHPASLACSMMRHARSIQFCFAPGCSESAQSSGRVYMRCSGCRIVAYSSKECQKRAWTDKHLPHKDICKKMKQVYDIGGNYLHREADEDKFARAMKVAKISDAMLDEIGMWLCAAYMRLQRKGPFLTAEVRKFLAQKQGPLFAEGVEEYIKQLESSFMSGGKRQRKGKK